MKKRRRKKDWLLILIFLAGFSVLLYPTISNFYNSFHESKAIAAYESSIGNYTKEDFTNVFDTAEAYNTTLAGQNTQSFENGEPVSEEYSSQLAISQDGMMGYITIPKLSVQMPIYHGSAEAVLAVGAGHLEGSSLPIGGIGTHAVLTGHRGLPSAKLFTDIDRLTNGDTFTIHVLNETLTYQIDNIAVVDPDELDLLKIDPAKDYCTLITCTPYGINTQRLLVRGVRIENAEELEHVSADAVRVDPLLTALAAAAPVVIVLLIAGIVHYRKQKKGQETENEKN